LPLPLLHYSPTSFPSLVAPITSHRQRHLYCAMKRFITSCMCLILPVSLPRGCPKYAHASSFRKLTPEQRPSPSEQMLPKSNSGHLRIAFTNTTNTTNATTQAPTPAIVPATPTPPPTPTPTRKYHPSPDDDEEEEEKKGPKVGVIFGWIVFSFAAIWACCYFRDAIIFFLATAWNNTRNYGCTGCLRSFFPCIFGSQSSAGGGGEPLDQIIFESEDPNIPLMS